MAVSLHRLFASNLLTTGSVGLFRPAVGSYSRFFNSSLDDCNYNYNLKFRGSSTSRVRDIFNEAFCTRLSATSNLTRLLNLVDDQSCVEHTTFPRWDVRQDTKAFYLVRNMAGLPEKDVEELDGSYRVFGCVRVSSNEQAIKFIVGEEGPNPGAFYYGYFVRIYLPSRFYNTRDLKMDVKNDILKITIPKEKGKWVRNISIDLKLV